MKPELRDYSHIKTAKAEYLFSIECTSCQFLVRSKKEPTQYFLSYLMYEKVFGFYFVHNAIGAIIKLEDCDCIYLIL